MVDAANVIGSVPDGWWRNRLAAAERLRDSLVPYAREGLPGRPALDVVLVVEGAARALEPVPGIRVEAAPGSGDNRIVQLVSAEEERPCLVVTADRGLRERVRALGAEVTGPRTVRPEAGTGQPAPPVTGAWDGEPPEAEEPAGPEDAGGRGR